MKKELTVKELHFITWDNQERIEENVRIEMSYDWEKKQPWEKGRPYTVVLHFKDGTDYRASFDRVEECQTMFVGVTDVCNMLTILDTPKEFWDTITYCKHPYSIDELESLLRNVVDFEAEEGEYARGNLADMGFSEEQMEFFGLRDED